MDKTTTPQQYCLECGNHLDQIPGRRPRKFCCDKCRTTWWQRQHKEEPAALPRVKDTHICEQCGKIFFAYGQNARKYCSRECFTAARIAAGEICTDDEASENDARKKALSAYARNPYVKSITKGRIELSESFYVAAYPLLEVGVDRILSTFGLEPSFFTSLDKTYIYGCLLKMAFSPIPEDSVVIDDYTVLIMAKRVSVMESLIEEKLREIGVRLKKMSYCERKEICLMIRNIPKDPGGVFTTSHMLSLVGISRNSYYCYIGEPRYGLTVSDRDALDEPYVRLAFEYKNYKKGYRMVYMLIPILTGRKIGIDRVRRIMRKYGMHCDVRKAKTNRQEEEDKRKKYHKPNLLRRMFRLHRPNEVRITDVTHLKYGDKQKAYGSALMDPVTGVLVAFVVSDHNDLELAKETLRRADSHPCKDGGIFHSDQGSVYLSPQFQKEVEEMGFDQSMSKRGNCWDNAPQESFFGHFKDECDYSGCSNLDELRAVIDDYSYYYNNERGLWDRKHMTPIQYEAYLLSLNDDEFAKYMALEEQKYAEMKTNAAEKAKERYKTLGV